MWEGLFTQDCTTVHYLWVQLGSKSVQPPTTTSWDITPTSLAVCDTLAAGTAPPNGIYAEPLPVQEDCTLYSALATIRLFFKLLWCCCYCVAPAVRQRAQRRSTAILLPHGAAMVHTEGTSSAEPSWEHCTSRACSSTPSTPHHSSTSACSSKPQHRTVQLESIWQRTA